MKSIDIEKYKFRLRSLPNFKTIPVYFEYYVYFLIVFIVYNFIDICLFKDGLVPTFSAPFVIAIPIIFVNAYIKIENNYKNVTKDTFKEIIVHIRLRQSQELIEKLSENPEILNASYKKKSLLYWARHYKNVEANSIIINILKKPK